MKMSDPGVNVIYLGTALIAALGWGNRSLAGVGVVESAKPQVVIMTDMTHDDGNSLIRYLYYSHLFDTRGIIVTTQLPDYGHDSNVPWNKAQQILEAYREEFDQLRKHHPDYPEPDDLLSVTHRGRGALPILWLTNEREFKDHIADRFVTSSWGEITFHDWIGEGETPNGESKDSPGSEYLLELFREQRTDPLYVQMWGGPITFVQALYRYRQETSPAEFQRLLDRLHVFGILLQDITFDFMVDLDLARNLSCGLFGTVESTFAGERVSPRWLLHDSGHFWRYCCPEDRSTKPMHAFEVRGHGPMSDLYDDGGEGDTPAFLYLLSAQLGLNDPLDPTQGSWGSRFQPMGADFPDGYFHTCDLPAAELYRWIPDAKASFLNRLRYSTHEPDEVNHEPTPVLMDSASPTVMHHEVIPGETVRLDAGESFDRDGDTLSFRWWVYHEASSYALAEMLRGGRGAEYDVEVPADLGDADLHVILEVRDDGNPSLVAYRRVILQGKSP